MDRERDQYRGHPWQMHLRRDQSRAPGSNKAFDGKKIEFSHVEQDVSA
jgi:hypothetical protein